MKTSEHTIKKNGSTCRFCFILKHGSFVDGSSLLCNVTNFTRFYGNFVCKLEKRASVCLFVIKLYSCDCKILKTLHKQRIDSAFVVC